MLYKKNIIILIIIYICLYIILNNCSYNIKKENFNPESYLKIAEKYYKEKKYSDSIDYYKLYIKNNYLPKEENYKYLYKISQIYYTNLNNTKNSIKYLKKIIKYQPYNFYTEKSYILLANIYFNSHYYLKSINTLKKYKIKITNPKYLAYSYFLIGKSYYKLERYSNAVSYFSFVTKSNDASEELLYDTYYYLAQIFWDIYKDRKISYSYLKKLFDLSIKKENFDNVLLLYKKVRWKYINKKDGLKDNCVSSIAFDGDTVWLGLWLGGVVKFSRSTEKLQFFSTKDGLISKFIRDIKVDKDNVWVATFEGVSRYDKKYSKWYPYKSIPGISYQKIKSIAIDQNYVWFGTLGKGIQRYNKKTGQWDSFTKFSRNILKIKKDPYSDIIAFASLKKGLILYKNSKWTVYNKKNSGLESSTIKDITFDESNIYIATYKKGIYSFNKITKKIKKIKLNNIDDSLYINTIEYRNNKIFIGTLGDGVVIYDLKNKKTDFITIYDGLTSDSIMTIEFEKEYIWFGTVNDGVNILYAPEYLQEPI